MKERIKTIVASQPGVSIRQQCELLGVNRSSYYYEPVPENEYNLLLMKLIDEQYTKTPFYGSPKLTAWLRRSGHPVNIKRVKRLMSKLGIAAIYPTKDLSQPKEGHRLYPYLLRGMKIERPNQVWSADITYIRLLRGFLYLVAVIDWFSRYVLAWRLSNTLDASFCIEALKAALEQNCPDIFNTDQGGQFTGDDFTSVLIGREIRISMDAKGRAFDNIFVERLWRTVKYENVYLNNYETTAATHTGLGEYFSFYNYERPHQSLAYQTPFEVYSEKRRWN
jgi:putative transposase